MPWRPKESCPSAGCPSKTDGGVLCSRCRHVRPKLGAPDDSPGGVYSTRWWRNRRLEFLAARPFCVICGAVATVADHYPESRRVLVASGVADPDADDRLRAVCKPCHDRSTAARQPGGWNAGNER